MPLVNRVISNLFGGVSQQPAGIRLDNQCEELVNGYPSLADGLVKRPPSEFIATLGGAAVPWTTVSMWAGTDAPAEIRDSAETILTKLPDLAIGHSILVSGFTSAQNNGTFVVPDVFMAVHPGAITINTPEGVVEEAAGNNISITDLGVL